MLVLSRKSGEQLMIGPVGSPTWTVKVISTAYERIVVEINGATRGVNYGESVDLSDSVRITVRNIERGCVSLGIAAPKDVPIHRAEVHQRVLLEQKLATDGRGPLDRSEYRRDAAFASQVRSAL